MQNPPHTQASASLPPLLKKFHKLKQRGKALYVEAYKIMAASTEVLKIQFGQQENSFSATAYFACLIELLQQHISQFGSN
jgi:hypothetical protein